PFPHPPPPRLLPLSLHDALPISRRAFAAVLPIEARATRLTTTLIALRRFVAAWFSPARRPTPSALTISALPPVPASPRPCRGRRSEEHTSELQSRGHLVCRLLLE